MTPLPDKPSSEPEVPPRSLIFGCGYLGRRVAEMLVFAGENVWATTRSTSKAQQLQQAGIQPVLADWLESSTLQKLPPVERLLIAVSYDRHSDVSRRQSQLGGLENLLRAIDPATRVCYISTTGVYHQRDGAWVDEDSAAEPDREGGRVHLEAEQLLRQQRSDGGWTILRLAGIYGPGRVPRVRDVIEGKPIASPEMGYLNLIHVADAARAVIASWDLASWDDDRQPLYLVADDHPVVRGEFYREVARQCGVGEPTFVPPDKNSSAAMRSNSNKRIRNTRLKRDLVPQLQYPTYREGLADVLRQDRD